MEFKTTTKKNGLSVNCNDQTENIYLLWKIIQKCSYHLQVEATIHKVSAFMELNVLYTTFQPNMLFWTNEVSLTEYMN